MSFLKPIQPARGCSDCPGTISPRNGMTTTFGVPVEPPVPMATATVATRSGNGSHERASASISCRLERAGSAQSSQSATTRLAPETSSSRRRSHAGRSHRIGSTHAPSFQAPNVTKTCSAEFGSPTARVASARRPFNASRCPICVERRSISCQEHTRSSPESEASIKPIWSLRLAANCCIRLPKEIGPSSANRGLVIEPVGSRASAAT